MGSAAMPTPPRSRHDRRTTVVAAAAAAAATTVMTSVAVATVVIVVAAVVVTSVVAPPAGAYPAPLRSGLATLGQAGTALGTNPSATASTTATMEAQVVTLVNRERARARCRPLVVDSRLVRAARGHSLDMARRNYFAHTTPAGVTFSTRITRAGYRWSRAGENIAGGQRTAADVMRAWMRSPGHRANILNCRFRHIGVGVAVSARSRYSPLWTQNFGTPR